MQRVIADGLPNSVVPLFLATGPESFEHWGSAVLLHFDDAFFLVTAGHVIAGRGGNQNLLMQGWNGHLTKTPDQWLRTRIPENGPQDDRNDLAVALLTEEMVAGFFQHGLGFLDQGTIDPLPVLEHNHLVFVGFPAQSQTLVHGEHASLVHLRPTAFHTKLARRSEAVASEFAADHYLVAEFRFSERLPFANQPSGVPLPPGMSGGAVYRMVDGRPGGFVGVTHRWIDPGLLIATRAHAIWPMLERELKNAPEVFRYP